MKIYPAVEKTGPQTIAGFGEFAERGRGPEVAAQAWTDAGFGDEMTARWLRARCFDPSAARDLAEFGVTPEQAACRTRDGGKEPYLDTIAFKVANGDLTVRQAEAREKMSHQTAERAK